MPAPKQAEKAAYRPCYCKPALTNSVQQISADPVNVHGFSFQNPGASDAYVQFFDALATNVTLGTTAPIYAVWVPAGGAWSEPTNVNGQFGSLVGLSIAATATANGSSAPASPLIANVLYL